MMTLPISYYIDVEESCRLFKYRIYNDINHWLPTTDAPRSAKAKAYSRPSPKTNRTIPNYTKQSLYHSAVRKVKVLYNYIVIVFATVTAF